MMINMGLICQKVKKRWFRFWNSFYNTLECFFPTLCPEQLDELDKCIHNEMKKSDSDENAIKTVIDKKVKEFQENDDDWKKLNQKIFNAICSNKQSYETDEKVHEAIDRICSDTVAEYVEGRLCSNNKAKNRTKHTKRLVQEYIEENIIAKKCKKCKKCGENKKMRKK